MSGNISTVSYYGSDVILKLRDQGKFLHVLRDGEKCKLTLFSKVSYKISKGVSLGSVSLEEMKKAVKEGILRIAGMILKIPAVKALMKLLEKK